MKTLRILLSCICIFLSSTIYAYDFEVDGLYYNFLEQPFHSVQLTINSDESWKNTKYTGDFIIPDYVTYCGIKYRVASVDTGNFFQLQGNGITSLYIPSTIEDFENTYLIRFPELKGITVASDNPKYFSKDGVLYHNYTFGITHYIILECCPPAKEGVVTIPDDVEVIQTSSFHSCELLTDIIIPDGVTKTGQGAFSGCSGLTTIAIPSTLTNIGEWAFDGCCNLRYIEVDDNNTQYSSSNGVLLNKDKTEIIKYPEGKSGSYVIPTGVTSIGDAFKNCVKLTQITIPDGISEVNLSGCKGLTSINIPSGVTTLNLSDCDNITSVTLPEGITTVIMRNCTSLTELNIPKSVTSLDLNGCTSLASITLPDAIESLDLGGCESLNSVVIPKGTKEIDLSNLTRIEHVTLPTSLLSLKMNNCPMITSISLPSNLKYISMNNCENLTNLTIPNNVEYLSFSECSKLNNVKIPNSAKEINFEGCKSLTSITIPGTMTSLNSTEWIGPFKDCESLENVVIENGLQSIPARTFSGCKNLRTVSLPASIKIIGDDAFLGCSSLESIQLPNALKSIGVNCFHSTSLKNITLPETIESIGDYSFAHVPFTEIIIPSSLMQIGDWAFYDCKQLQKVEIKSPITSIPSGLFSNCESLECVTIPSNVTVIKNRAFQSCPSIETLDLPMCLKTLEEGVFSFCTGLKYMSLPTELECIDNLAFSNCTSLQAIDMPKALNTLGDQVFSNCTSLTSIDIPEGIDTLHSLGYNLSSLTTITLPRTLQSIDGSALYGCSALNSIYCLAPIPPNTTYGYAFWGIDNLSAIKLYVLMNEQVISSYQNDTYWGKMQLSVFDNSAYGNSNINILRTLWDDAMNKYNSAVEGNEIGMYKSGSKAELYEVLQQTASMINDDMTAAQVVECSNLISDALKAFEANKIKSSDTPDDNTTPSTPSNIEASTDISSYSNVLYFNDIESRTGDFNLELNMKCAEENITAFQCDVFLPEGVTWKSTTDKRGNIVYNLPTFNEDRTDNSYHTINPIAKNSDGSYKIIVYSMQKDNILETDGALLYLPLQISEEMESGEYNISVKNIVLTDVHTQQTLVDEVVSKLTIPSYVIGDANGDDMINVTDIVSIISYILGEADSNFTLAAADINGDGAINVTDIVGVIDIILNANPDMTPAMMSRAIAKAAPKVSGNDLQVVPFTVSEGTTSTTAKLNMNNPGDEFTAFQCEVEFPEGISWASTVDKRGNVKYTAPTFDAEADRTDASYHTVEIGKNASGNINIFVYSMQKEVILDEEGAVLDLPFVVDDNLTPGIYDVKIKNIVMTRTDQSDVKPADYTFSILVGSPAESTIALNGNFTDEAINEYNTALATNTTVAAIDLSDAADVSSNTAFATGNQNLVLYVAEDAVVKNTNNVVIGDECANLILTDGYSFATPKAFTANNASYSRTMDTTWGTICLPYAVASDESTAYYEITGVENDVITLTKYDELPAGTPALVKKLSGTEITPQATSVAVSVDINDVTGTVKMYGSYTNKVRVEDPNSYYIYNNKFYSCNEYFFCNAFRAYFTLESAGAKMLRIADDDDVVTAIDALTGEGNGTGVESIYGEDGILRKDMEKGMNIVKLSNGKTQKIIIK